MLSNVAGGVDVKLAVRFFGAIGLFQDVNLFGTEPKDEETSFGGGSSGIGGGARAIQE